MDWQSIHSRQKWVLGGVAIVAILLVFIIGLSVWFRPGHLVGSAFSKLAQAETQKFQAVIQIENNQTTQALLGEQAVIILNVDGAFKRQADARDSLAADVELTAKTESLSMLIEIELRFIGDQAYLLVKKAPLTFPGLAALKGQWIALPRGGDETPSELNPDSQLFSGLKRIGNVEVNQKPARQYEISATSDAVLRMLDGIAAILGTRLTNEQIVNFRQGVASVEALPVTVVVTPWSRQLLELATTLSLPAGNQVDFTISFSEHSQPIEIIAPETAAPLP